MQSLSPPKVSKPLTASENVLMTSPRLKCDRQQPCKACVDRGLSLSCTFSRHPQAPSTPETKATHNVHDRIDQLEKLVTSLMNEKRNGTQETPSPMASYSPRIHVGDTDTDVPGTPDRVKLETNETSYTNSGHWTSILDGVSIRSTRTWRPRLRGCVILPSGIEIAFVLMR